MIQHETLSGHKLAYREPQAGVQAFLNRLLAATDDANVTYDQLVALVYGRDNPVLNQTVFKAGGGVTPEVLRNPVYALMRDLLERKATQQGLLVPERDFADYTLTVAQAAQFLGLHETAVVKAIRAWKLPARKFNGQWRLTPAGVHLYQVYEEKSRRTGRKPASAKVKVAG
ncbi:MAG: helix-turn-helix domain-containing protein [Candidatus Lambdaproteobacteria bacterium]|nr:helix-turn-helix domain-containing protein [Candidatus Lambdaproteobacteria bacterium]